MITSSSKFIAIIEWGSEYYVKNFADREDFYPPWRRLRWMTASDGFEKFFASYESRIIFFSFIQNISKFLTSVPTRRLSSKSRILGPYITAQRPNPFLYIIHLMSDPEGNSFVFPRVLMFPETKWTGPRVTGPHSAGNSQDIGMDFGIDKCMKLMLRRGKVTPSVGIQLPGGRKTKSLVEGSRYEYL